MVPNKIYIRKECDNSEGWFHNKINNDDIEYIRVDKLEEILLIAGHKARKKYMKTKKAFDGGYAIAFDDIDTLIQEELLND